MATVTAFPNIEQPTQGFPKATEPVVSLEAMNKSEDQIYVSEEGDHIFLSGIVTKKFSVNLRALGGTYNKGIQKWSFNASDKSHVDEFLDGVRQGRIQPEPFVGFTNKKKLHTNGGAAAVISNGSGGEFKLPTINKSGSHMSQVGPWSVFTPKTGMIAQVKVQGQTFNLRVTSVNGNSSDGFEAIVTSDKGEQSLLQITNGHWAMRGIIHKHTIRFVDK